MSNLENLIHKILEDGKIEVAKIKEESKKNNEEIINSRIKEAKEKKERILEKSKTEAIMLKERIISEAELRVRDEKLRTKREVLDKVFDLAKENLRNIDEKDYMKFLKNNLDKLDLKGSESLIVPKKFKQIVQDIYPNVTEDENIESGFWLKDSNIMNNYSFDSLVDFVREDLEGEIAKELFQE